MFIEMKIDGSTLGKQDSDWWYLLDGARLSTGRHWNKGLTLKSWSPGSTQRVLWVVSFDADPFELSLKFTSGGELLRLRYLDAKLTYRREEGPAIAEIRATD